MGKHQESEVYGMRLWSKVPNCSNSDFTNQAVLMRAARAPCGAETHPPKRSLDTLLDRQ